MKLYGFKLVGMTCLLILILLVTACTGGTTPTDTTGATPGTTAAPETVGQTQGETVPETETAPEVVEPDAVIKADSSVIVTSVYAAQWEKDMVETLAAELGLSVVNDTNVPEEKSKLVIGYTTLNSAFGADFDACGDLGYMVIVKGGNLLVAANTQTGLTAAVEVLRANLTADGVYPASAGEVVKKSSEEEAEVQYAGAWAENIAHADELANGVTTHFKDIRRTLWELKNRNVIINYDMKDAHCIISITNANGIPYALNTGDVYLVDAEGKRLYMSNSRPQGRTNIYQLGYYYYSAHIMDENVGLRAEPNGLHHFSLDRTFHMYSDKLNVVQHLTTTGGDASGLSGYGQVYTIDASRVLRLVIKDKDGVHDSLDGVDFDSCEYVGFDVERAGVIGFILLPYEENEGQLIVTLENGVYTVDQHIDSEKDAVYAKGVHLYFGMRMYTMPDHDLDTFCHEAECERNPLEGLSISKNIDGAAYVGYDALRGAYRFDVNGSDFGQAYYNSPNQYFTINAEIKSDAKDRNIYVYTHTYSGCLESAVIMSMEKTLLPIPLEVTKNFCGENEDSFYIPGDTAYGEVFFPITLKAGEKKNFTVLNLYQNWGNYPLKQLSSIQFMAPYYHLSTGVTETNCIAPTYVYGKDFWTLPDFRAMSAPLWASQPQHTAIGQLYVVRYDGYIDGKKEVSNIENYQNDIDSYGPVYADVTMDYLSQGGHMHISNRHVEMPQTDENRTYYSVRVDVLKEITFNDFKSEFSIFGFNGRHPRFNKLGYLDENNEHQVLDLQIANATNYDRFFKLGDEYPFFDYFEPLADDAVNFAIIIKDWSIVIGGETYSGGFVMRDRFMNNLNYCDLSLDLGEVTLKPGDYIYVDYILLPWGYVDSKDDSNVLNVRKDSCIDPYRLEVETGTVVEDVYVPKIRVDENQSAVFTLSGGSNNGVVRVYGLTSYERPVVQELVNGNWVTYKDATFQSYDGYTVYADEDGTYSIAFVVSMDDAAEGRTFRVTGK